MSMIINIAEAGLFPDVIIRAGIRMLNRKRLREEHRGGIEALREHQRAFIEMLRKSPIAVMTDAANEQHYEVPPDLFLLALGKNHKYSCCHYPIGTETLDEAEEKMLALTCGRAQIINGMDILELGCGWGSLTLWMAERYPGSRITAVSNSRPQREFIKGRCRELGFPNVEVITADMNHFDTEKRFDRVVSVEMFEHMRNYELLLRKIASWMKTDAKLFVHIFCHKEYAYTFETEGTDNWMGKYFFSGGIMPSDDLLLYFQDDVALEDHWRVDGRHYERTANHWLANMDSKKVQIVPVLELTYGKKDAARWFQRWRIFFMACAELWGFRNGQEWWVAHYLFRKRIS
jgi:cyclopropane-fatty-acyl-phospholipid synthase